MINLNKKAVLLLIVLLFIMLVCAKTFAAQDTVRLTFAGGPQGGTWNLIAAALSEEIKKQIPGSMVTVLPGGSATNFLMVANGEADIGLCHPFIAMQGYQGIGEFEGRDPVKNVMGLTKMYEVYWQYAARKDLPVSNFKELKEKQYPIRQCVYAVGNLAEIITRMVFDNFGFTYDDIKSWGGVITYAGVNDAISLITDGHADSFTPLFPFPAAQIVQLQQSRDINIWSIDEENMKVLEAQGFGKAVIPAGTYEGIDYDVITVSAPVFLIAREDLSEDIIYDVTKAYVEAREKFAASISDQLDDFPIEALPVGLGLPIHPGAKRYFEEEQGIVFKE